MTHDPKPKKSWRLSKYLPVVLTNRFWDHYKEQMSVDDPDGYVRKKRPTELGGKAWLFALGFTFGTFLHTLPREFMKDDNWFGITLNIMTLAIISFTLWVNYKLAD